MLRTPAMCRRLLYGLVFLSTVVLIINIKGVSDYLTQVSSDPELHLQHVTSTGTNNNTNTTEQRAHSERFMDPGYIDQRQQPTYLSEQFRTRQDHLHQVCLQKGFHPPDSLVTSTFSNRMMVQLKHTIVYCPVQKVASSFWTKTLAAISSRGRYNSPYQLQDGSKYRPISYQKLKRRQTLNDKFLNNLNNGVALIVVRDPYTKLFSAYADKFYNPNWLYWGSAGVEIQKIIGQRQEAPGHLLCGNDVSFSDFIKYIIHQYDNDLKVDRHFTTITEHCHPCHTKFNYISKLETFKEDTLLILDDWRKRFGIDINFQDFEKESALEVAKKHTRLVFHTMAKYANKCKIPRSNFYLRLWRFLQISGILPKDIEMPFEDTDTVSAEDFNDEVETVLAGNITWEAVKRQRQEALEQAYNTVDRQHMFKLRDIVLQDCMFFQYNDQPKSLFKKHTAKYELDFKYFPGLQRFTGTK